MLKTKDKHKMFDEFRNAQKNITYVIEDEKKKPSRGFENIKKEKRGRATTNHYDIYRCKYDKGDIDKFNYRDIVYFFTDLAKENGCNYIIPNIKVEICKVKNIMNKGYSPTDMVAMIEFLFTSGQTYLDTKSLTPGILATGWCNRIYNDTQDWLNNEYDPNKTFKNKSKKNRLREWQDDEGDDW